MVASSPAPSKQRWGRAVAGAMLAAGLVPTAAAGLIKGVSYGPTPVRTAAEGAALPQDDWMADEAVAMWGLAGRGDLRLMRRMGANLVRLYGNNPANSHTNFLDTAHSEGLMVATGMSDYPYYQQVPGNCQTTGFDCFSQVKPLYAENLQKGFLVEGKRYHPAIKYVNILNEPDLKMPATATTGDETGIREMCRSLVSAFDAMLQAEKEAEVSGPLPNYTATFSYATCSACAEFAGKPALGQMAQLDDAMKNPERYGYSPINDVAAAYQARFVHSFNTQNPASDLQDQFLNDYQARFATTPVYIGEYHRVQANQVDDLTMILNMAEENPLFLGISFFQFQVAYWKGGSETDFGMFGLSDESLLAMPYFGQTYSVDCLTEQPGPDSNMSIAAAVAEAYGGEGVDVAELCGPNPWAVPLNQTGFAALLAERNVEKMEDFVERTASHLGAFVKPSGAPAVEDAAVGLLQGSPGSFGDLVQQLSGAPEYLLPDTYAKCVADRTALPSTVEAAVAAACSTASFSCEDIPADCSSDPYVKGDYVFSRRYEELGAASQPLRDCYAGGAAVYAPSAHFMRNSWSRQCVDGAAAMPEPDYSITPLLPRGRGLINATTASPDSSSAQPASPEPEPEPSRSSHFLPRSHAASRSPAGPWLLALLALTSSCRPVAL